MKVYDWRGHLWRNPETIDRLILYWENTSLTAQQIGEKLANPPLSQAAVAAKARRMGLKPRPRGPKPWAERKLRSEIRVRKGKQRHARSSKAVSDLSSVREMV